jgi:cyclic pyranopterin phosphate synthase
MIVDISAKPDVHRFAAASVTINGAGCNTAAAVRAAESAYRFLPFLHPLRLTAGACCEGRRLYVRGAALWSTGVEMDALFGALVGAIASGSSELRDLAVEVKLKGLARGVTGCEGSGGTLARGEGLAASAYGEMEVRSCERVRDPADKGHPIYAAQTAAALNVKRLCELVEGPCPAIRHFKIDIDVRGCLVTASAKVAARDLSPAPEAMFAVGVALLTIWDVIKKWEKDESGQYPGTRIRLIALL